MGNCTSMCAGEIVQPGKAGEVKGGASGENAGHVRQKVQANEVEQAYMSGKQVGNIYENDYNQQPD